MSSQLGPSTTIHLCSSFIYITFRMKHSDARSPNNAKTTSALRPFPLYNQPKTPLYPLLPKQFLRVAPFHSEKPSQSPFNSIDLKSSVCSTRGIINAAEGFIHSFVDASNEYVDGESRDPPRNLPRDSLKLVFFACELCWRV